MQDESDKLKQEQEIRDRMKKLGGGIQEELPPNWGFALMVFPLGDKQARLNYISNGKRSDVMDLLRQFVYRSKNGNIVKEVRQITDTDHSEN